MIEDILPRYQEIADGEKTAFTVPFDVLDNNFIIVYQNDNKQTSGYTISEKTVTFTTAPIKDTLITIQRVVPIDWTFDSYGALNSETLGNIITRIVAEIQTIKEESSRAFKTRAYDAETGESQADAFIKQMREALDILEQFQELADTLADMKAEIDQYIDEASTTVTNYINSMTSDKIAEFTQLADSKTRALEEKTEYLESIAEDTEYIYNHKDSIAFFKEWPSSRI